MIAFPMSAVIAGMITIYLAVVTSDGLVVDDYFARDEAAARYQLKASIDLDLRNNRMQLQLESATAESPQLLTFSLLHPTRPGHDQMIMLQHAGDGFYAGEIDELSRGRWYLQLEGDDWRLSGEVQIPQTETAVLLPLDVDE